MLLSPQPIVTLATMASSVVYLDHNSTTKPEAEVVSAVAAALSDSWGNPSTGHAWGVAAKSVLENARQDVAQLVDLSPEAQVTFTSGGSESVNWAIKGLAMHYAQHPIPGHAKPHIVTAAFEHASCLNSLAQYQAAGLVEFTVVPISPACWVSPAQLAAAVQPNTVLVSVMLANNETGVVQPMASIAAACRAAAAQQAEAGSRTAALMIHADGSQAVGKVPVSWPHLQVDALTAAGHKMYGPKGVGVLCHTVEMGKLLVPLVHGAPQEGGRRAGTENVALAAGMAAAARAARAWQEAGGTGKEAALRSALWQQLSAQCPKALVLHGLAPGTETDPGSAAEVDPVASADFSGTCGWRALPNTLYVSFPGVLGRAVQAGAAHAVAASAGAACHDKAGGSPVLAAMGVPADIATGALRLSLGRHTTGADISKAAAALSAAYSQALEPGSAGTSAPATVPGDDATEPLYLQDTEEYSRWQAGRLLAAGQVQADCSIDWTTRVPAVAQACEQQACAAPSSVPNGSVAWIASATLLHPQGGGQPADRGLILPHKPCGMPGAYGLLATDSRKWGQYVVHFGTLVSLPEPAARAAGLALSAAQSTEIVDAAAAQEQAASAWAPELRQPLSFVVHGAGRVQAAALHSAGHAVDVAVHAAFGHLESGKGYHFADGPYVEYGAPTLTAEQVTAAQAQLQAELDELIAQDIPTVIQHVAAEDAAACAGASVSPDTLRAYGFAEDCPVRVVAVAGHAAVCPCGGTHVKSSADLAGLRITGLRLKKKKLRVSYAV